MPKNIIVCCDGTANEYGEKNSNVVKLFSILEKDPAKQATFYDPGVGTFSAHPAMTKVMRGFMKALGLGFGLGITENIEDAYRYLMQTYEEGDRVYLFGFSRGAYTARAVAGMLHKVGLLAPDNENLVPYASRMFKRVFDWKVYDGFKRTFCRPCPVHFLGIWDTVTSVGWMWDPVSLPHTTNNPSIDIIRHAVAIDERRSFYRQNMVRQARDDQDVQQVWFAGVHSDVGGGAYPENQNGFSHLTLEWMIVEAFKHGLLIDKEEAKAVTAYPDALNDPIFHENKSLTFGWWPLEFWPKLAWSFEKQRRYPRLNLGRRRWIRDESRLHDTVRQRMELFASYRPKNRPENPTWHPWERLETILD